MPHAMMCLLLPSTSNLWFPKMWKILCWALRGILTEEKILISLHSGPNFHECPTFSSGLQASLIQLMASVESCRRGPDHFTVVVLQPEVGTERSHFWLWSPQRKKTILLRCCLTTFLMLWLSSTNRARTGDMRIFPSSNCVPCEGLP